MRFRTIAIATTVLLLVIVGSFYGLRSIVFAAAERNLLDPHKNGTATPSQYGAAYTPFWFESGGRKLEAYQVTAPASCRDRLALLIFHGRGEAVSSWAKAQAFLATNCVSSMVFDYSGFGNSAPPAHIATADEDAVAAYRTFVERFPAGWRRCVLGHSMGNAPMLHAYPSFRSGPDCVVVANAFSSVQDMALAGGAPGPLAAFLSGVWDNTKAIKAVTAPLMVVHGDADTTIPRAFAARLDASAPNGAQRLTLHGFGHNALYDNPDARWWAPVLSFMHGS